MPTKSDSTPPQVIRDLVEKFAEHRETQLRQDYLDPLFIALGWDVYNTQGYSELYRDVILEQALRVEKSIRAPDYCFRIGGTPKFFVEAKRPIVSIKTDVAPAFQLRRYAWTAKLPLSILTDFEELAVYDCRQKPFMNDKASTARVMFFSFTDYLDKWEEIASVFSRESVLRGSFDKYADSTKKKRGTAEVDQAFLEEIESWRESLAKNLSIRNEKLTDRELNFSVQRIIDRIIFLRMCEGREIEPYERLQALLNGDKVYKRLVEMFHRADEKYNSGLFHFHPEKGREAPDELTPALVVDDKVIKDIVKRLYYPESPYEFAALPADILGQVYEQFLGKVIRLTAGHRAKIEEKPEVRKAGGVYYTPTYIVDYIVENTVGKLVEGKSPQEVGGLTKTFKPSKRGRPLAVLDPACGSGSFLIQAYQYLLDWYLKQYTETDDPQKHARGAEPRIYETSTGDWRLTIAERKRILLAHLYGVDVDIQAVEVTKLSLLLKALEGETKASVERTLFHKERALPDLAGNIKCGNSLVSSDFYEGKQREFLYEGDAWRINAFDWKTAGFGSVLDVKDGGFDAVIGNPPYIRIQTLKDTSPESVDYFGRTFAAAAKGNYDIYVVFIERALQLINRAGKVGMILPSKFLTTDYGEGLRKIITDRESLEFLVDFKYGQVFPSVATYTCLLFLSAAPCDKVGYASVMPPDVLQSSKPSVSRIPATRFSANPWSFESPEDIAILAKLDRDTTPLLGLPATISRGSSTGADDVFMLRRVGRGFETRDGERLDIERGILRTPVFASDFGRYRFLPESNEVVIFPYEVNSSKARLLPESEIREKYPNAYDYLRSQKGLLLERKQFRDWYSFSAPRNLDSHECAQIMIPLLADRGLCCRLPDNMEEYCPMASGGFSIGIQTDSDTPPEFILGLLNSTLLFWQLNRISNIFRGGWITCTKQYVGTLPVRIIDQANKADSKRRDRVVELVQRIVDLQSRVATTRTAHERTLLIRQIGATDQEIDQVVYELYELDAKSIAHVEALKPPKRV